ncbi:flagellar hook-basal body protein [Solimicrobium silvestre]|uniref:Flagellar hook-basal body protein n=1 Tax=Solimicrobium silvestre TaxID=2099400 RepID=A0A2S9H1T3_9BURK|nr:flagellar hook-basal body complex protein [Solimicrobium silvestre]PRC93903.1 Flagellar hook-basal body protein [Solimicrobium silvestre]
MNNSLYIAATGMQAQQLNLDTIANNLTNLSTNGFKSSVVNFQELMYVDPVGARSAQTEMHSVHSGMHGVHGDHSAHGIQSTQGQDSDAATSAITPYGTGVSVGSVTKDFSLGTMTQTNSQMDLAIQGNGFLEVTMPDGSHAYTRGGTLSVGADNFLMSPQGYELKPSIRLPANPTSITIAQNGQVSVTTGTSAQPTQVGQIELANFNNPGALNPQGNGIYVPTAASGNPTYSVPGSTNAGTLAQGSLEGSNVNMVNQMVNLMVAQRAYELSSKVVQTADELMSLTNNLRR